MRRRDRLRTVVASIVVACAAAAAAGAGAAARADVERLAIEQARAAALAAPPVAAGSLDRPAPGPTVARFGVYEDEATHARLPRRGVEISSKAGAAVLAPAAGKVLFAGP